MYCDPVQSSVAAPASRPRSAQLEWAWGITDWLELGAYAAVYSWTGDGRFLIDGAKLRAEFVVPHAAERSFFYGVDFELGCNARYWGTDPPSGEIRPIIGGRLGPVDPILGTSFQGLGALDFTPASRVAYQFPKLGQRRWNTMPITVASTSLSLWAGSSSSSSRSSTIRALRYTSNWGSATASRRLQTVWCSN